MLTPAIPGAAVDTSRPADLNEELAADAAPGTRIVTTVSGSVYCVAVAEEGPATVTRRPSGVPSDPALWLPGSVFSAMGLSLSWCRGVLAYGQTLSQLPHMGVMIAGRRPKRVDLSTRVPCGRRRWRWTLSTWRRAQGRRVGDRLAGMTAAQTSSMMCSGYGFLEEYRIECSAEPQYNVGTKEAGERC